MDHGTMHLGLLIHTNCPSSLQGRNTQIHILQRMPGLTEWIQLAKMSFRIFHPN